ncbi:hypothetical protein WJX81_003542 [Elliptochloris bilobata]|uniref:Uncharacterized protein n=1 Tax=Elliptochloris bilobata TaxID=381761 RepID=A0AAW1S066_9CHLO
MGPGAAETSASRPTLADDDSSDDEPLGARLKKGPAPKRPTPAAPKVKAEKRASGDGAAKGAVGGTAGKVAGKPEKGKAEPPNRAKKEPGESVVKRERKVYDMPGQTKPTPDELDPLRKFYTSTLEQLPGSEMAKRWLLQHGLLLREEAEELVGSQKSLKSPGKSPAANRSRPAVKMEGAGMKEAAAKKAGSGSKSATKRPAKRKAVAEESEDKDDDDDEDEDFGAKMTKRTKGAKRAAKAATKAVTADVVQTKAAAAGGRAKTKMSGPSAVKKPVVKKSQKDVAFADGGLDSEDDSF